jgi:hypothetical protein
MKNPLTALGSGIKAAWQHFTCDRTFYVQNGKETWFHTRDISATGYVSEYHVHKEQTCMDIVTGPGEAFRTAAGRTLGNFLFYPFAAARAWLDDKEPPPKPQIVHSGRAKDVIKLVNQ